jgi:DNA polymerase-3 subunit delta
MKEYKNILNDIAQRNFAPVYLLDGDEPFYIDLLVRQFEEKIIPAAERDFNMITLYGRETTWQEVTGALRRYPMFGDKLLVLLKEADQMKNLNELAAYMENPMPTTILVIEHRFKKIDSRGKLSKLIQQKGVRFLSEKIKEATLPQWIMDYCREQGITIGPKESEMLAAYLGNDLQKITNELEKMLLNKKEKKEVSAELIATYIGISKEYNVFEFPDILFGGNKEKLALILNYFLANPKACPMPLVIGSFYNYLKGMYLSYYARENFQQDRKLGIWTKHRARAATLPELKVHRCIAILEEFSRKSVGIENLNKDGSLLKEMTGKMTFILEG